MPQGGVSPEREASLREAHGRGLSAPEIARELGLKVGTVRNYLSRLGISVNPDTVGIARRVSRNRARWNIGGGFGGSGYDED